MYSLYDMASACSSVPLSSWESDREKPRKRQPMHEDVLFRTRKEFDRHFSFAARYYCTWLLTNRCSLKKRRCFDGYQCRLDHLCVRRFTGVVLVSRAAL